MTENNKFFYIVFSVAIMLSFFCVSSAQDKESFYENQVISAVERYDANDFSGAADILKKVVAEAPSNDAAHYYLGLSYFVLEIMMLQKRS